MVFQLWWVLAFLLVMAVLKGVYGLILTFINRDASRSLPFELEQRLSRIEHTSESTAFEVERISESQRFLTKLLAQRGATDAVTHPTPPERVVTPH